MPPIEREAPKRHHVERAMPAKSYAPTGASAISTTSPRRGSRRRQEGRTHARRESWVGTASKDAALGCCNHWSSQESLIAGPQAAIALGAPGVRPNLERPTSAGGRPRRGGNPSLNRFTENVAPR